MVSVVGDIWSKVQAIKKGYVIAYKKTVNCAN